jgi:phosphate transport system substrate-binding protein
MKKPIYCTAFLIGCAIAGNSFAANKEFGRTQLRIVGSSTVYPFSTVVAERFGKSTKFKTPIVEATGTGGGFKLFCGGVGERFADLTGASRPIKSSETKQCETNKVSAPLEILIGKDGIVVATSKKVTPFALTRDQLFLALAKQVPDGNGGLKPNDYKKWSDIDQSLPSQKILAYGPPSSSGTRDAFVELAIEPACKKLEEYKTAYPDEDKRKKACVALREDGVFVEAGENDNLIEQKLEATVGSVGVFGYSFLEENADKIQGINIDGVAPEFEKIKSGEYPLSRPIFLYVKKEHIGEVDGIQEFISELTSEKAMGDEGYLAIKGLIPLDEAKRQEIRTNLVPYLKK